MSSNDYRERLRAMAQEERERMNDFILSEARRKEQKDLEPEPESEPTHAPVAHEPEPEPVAVVVEPPKPAPEPEPEPTKPKSKENIKRSFNFLAEGDVRDWLLYKRAKGYNCSSLIKRILAEYMAKDEGWIRHRSRGVEYEGDGGGTR